MRLGIMVTTGRALEQVVGLARAAAARGHAVEIFATDEGVRLLVEPRFTALSELPRVTMSYCETSADRHGVAPTAVPAAIARGSQFENALMSAGSDRVVVL